MNFQEVRDWFELLSYLAAIIGIPLAIYTYYRGKQSEQRLREKEALFTSHTLYVDYLKLCLENPDLNTYNTPDGRTLDEIQKKELIIFEILFTYLESAYLYYADQSDAIRRKQWKGWEEYIKDFSGKENFMKAWNVLSGQFDEDFMKFMNDHLRRKK